MDYQVVFHIDESPKWSLLLKNVPILCRPRTCSTGKLRVLANSEAIREYVNEAPTPERSRMLQLSGLGVRFVACNNALRALGIERDNLMPFVNIVPAGVIELVERQRKDMHISSRKSA